MRTLIDRPSNQYYSQGLTIIKIIFQLGNLEMATQCLNQLQESLFKTIPDHFGFETT